MADYIVYMGGYGGATTGFSNAIDIFKVTKKRIEVISNHGLTLSHACDGLAAATCSDYILAMGGEYNATAYYDTVDVFHANTNGVERVTGHGLTLSVGRCYLAAAACGQYILAMGGKDSTRERDTVDVFKVTENGVEKVPDHGLSLSVARYNLAAAACGNYILAMGGYNGSDRYNTVDVFKVTENGVETVPDHGLSLSQTRYHLAAASCGEYILAMGGLNGGMNYCNTVDVFHVTENGIEQITDHGLSLSVARETLAAASCGNYILAMGGRSGTSPFKSDAVDVFKVTENGVEAVQEHNLSLSEARQGLSAASCRDYILALGGTNSNAIDVFQVFD